MFEQSIVGFEAGGFSLVGAQILVDSEDYQSVHIAACNLAKDFLAVTGVSGSRSVTTEAEEVAELKDEPKSKNCIIVGSLDQSSTIRTLVEENKVDVTAIKGKWETWLTTFVSSPAEGYNNALVIVGSDKRGTTYGIYSLSEQIGVSPWYWWADVPIKKHPEIYALPVSTMNGEPSIKYRGIFINDEAPAMDTWFYSKFKKSSFDASLYHRIFELLLRLKANFLWPAMWRGYPYPGRSFFKDDIRHQALAHMYGIVVGTSHHEPMQRAMNEWSTTQPHGTWVWDTNKDAVTQYFDEGAERSTPYESYITLGMRGEGDIPVKGNEPSRILNEVLTTQRNIIKKHYGTENGVNQLIALYKEVQPYYDSGLKIPDDITLLFSDDNFGSLRRFPTEAEAKRPGGCGYYYHFQYTGYPRGYRWMNSNTLGKTLHQLQLAHSKGANRIWIFNVGDLKPIETPMSFAFDLAWDIKSIKNDGFMSYFESLATREFGKHTKEIAKIWFDFDRLVAIRKQDHIDPHTFLILKYREADSIVARWANLVQQAEELEKKIEKEYQPAFFQLVLHPVKASYICTSLRVTQYKNQLFGKQRRNSANVLFHKCISLLDEDHELMNRYHSLCDGKWNHLLRQPHYGYSSGGAQPTRNLIDGLCYVQTKEDSNPSVGHMGIAVEGHEGSKPGVINEDSDRTHPSRHGLEAGVTLPTITPYGPQGRFFEVFHRGTQAFKWIAKPQHTWIKLSKHQGSLNPDSEDDIVDVKIDWPNVPSGFDDRVFIEIIGSSDGYEKVHMKVQNIAVPADFTGFVESGGYLSIDAGNWVTAPYIKLPSVGRLLAGSVTLPNDTDFSKADKIPFLRYDIYALREPKNAELEVHFNMTLETDPKGYMEYDIRWDGGAITKYRLTDDPEGGEKLPKGWNKAVMDCIWRRKHSLGKMTAGKHTIEIRPRKANMILEKLIIDLGEHKSTYLGPPESDFVQSKGKTRNSVYIGSDDSLTVDLRF